MRWVTSELIHFDRVASAWLIGRFVDQEATFVFARPDDLPPDATPFGLPGTALAGHDAGGTTFERILRAYDLQDPALAAMGAIANSLVGYIMHGEVSGSTPEAAGLLGLIEGIMVRSRSDADCLTRSIPVYDALYDGLSARHAAEAVSSGTTMLEPTKQLARAVGTLRRDATPFSLDAFRDALAQA